DQPLRFSGDGAEDQRRLARTRDAGEHREPSLGDVEVDVFEIVHPGSPDADPVVAVGGVPAVGGVDFRHLRSIEVMRSNDSAGAAKATPSGNVRLKEEEESG